MKATCSFDVKFVENWILSGNWRIIGLNLTFCYQTLSYIMTWLNNLSCCYFFLFLGWFLNSQRFVRTNPLNNVVFLYPPPNFAMFSASVPGASLAHSGNFWISISLLGRITTLLTHCFGLVAKLFTFVVTLVFCSLFLLSSHKPFTTFSPVKSVRLCVCVCVSFS